MTDEEQLTDPLRRPAPPTEEVSVGGEPSPLIGAAVGLGKVVAAALALVGAAAVVAAIVALLY